MRRSVPGRTPVPASSRGDGDGLSRSSPCAADDGVPGEHRHPVAQQLAAYPAASASLPAARSARDAGQAVRGSGGLDQRGDRRTPAAASPVGHRQQQRPGPGDDDRAAGQHEPALEHGLRAAGRDHAGQGPAGEGRTVS